MKKIIIIAILTIAPAAMAIDESESICSNGDLTQVNYLLDESLD